MVELIGGADGPALALCQAALAAGKPVVTANKALLAHHGAELARLADATGATIGFEAAVAGGIPIVKTLREGLAGNRIRRVYGILNGTCNYILTTMRESGREFDAVLEDAQQLGYAEADPAFDIDGIDAAHKLSLLSALAFGCPPDFASVYTEGIRHVSPLDIAFASEMGYRIKLLGHARVDRARPRAAGPSRAWCGSARRSARSRACSTRWSPRATRSAPRSTPGAAPAAAPTASAVVADLADIARGRGLPAFGVPGARLVPLPRGADRPPLRRLLLSADGGRPAGRDGRRRRLPARPRGVDRGADPARAQPRRAGPDRADHARDQRGADDRRARHIGALPTVLEPPRMIRIEAL